MGWTASVEKKKKVLKTSAKLRRLDKKVRNILNLFQLNFISCLYSRLFIVNLVPRAMPVRGLGWHWLWGN